MSNPETTWHIWFAWHPVTTVDGDPVFLINVERKRHPESGSWMYRYPWFGGDFSLS